MYPWLSDWCKVDVLNGQVSRSRRSRSVHGECTWEEVQVCKAIAARTGITWGEEWGISLSSKALFSSPFTHALGLSSFPSFLPFFYVSFFCLTSTLYPDSVNFSPTVIVKGESQVGTGKWEVKWAMQQECFITILGRGQEVKAELFQDTHC